MSVEKDQLGETIRAAREARGLHQKDVANGIGVNVKQVGRWERGENFPGGLNLRDLILFFRVKRDLPDLAILEAAREAAEEVVRENADPGWTDREMRAMDLITRFRDYPDRFDIWLRDGTTLLDGKT